MAKDKSCMAKGGKVMPPGMKPMKMAKGGAVTRGDGVVSKGHTKGKMV